MALAIPAILLLVLVIGIWLGRRIAPRPGAPQQADSGHPDVAHTAGQSAGQLALDLGAKGDDFHFHIVGEASYQGELRRVAKTSRSFVAVLMAEPTNPYDPNAVRVIAQGGGTVGYLARLDAIDYCEVFALLGEHNHVGACRAKLIGGVADKRSFGVVLNLRDPEGLLVDVRDTLAPGSTASPNIQPF